MRWGLLIYYSSGLLLEVWSDDCRDSTRLTVSGIIYPRYTCLTRIIVKCFGILYLADTSISGSAVLSISLEPLPFAVEYPLMNGLDSVPHAQTKVVWKNVDLYGNVQRQAIRAIFQLLGPHSKEDARRSWMVRRSLYPACQCNACSDGWIDYRRSIFGDT
jgi:hypothetical protein